MTGQAARPKSADFRKERVPEMAGGERDREKVM